MNGSGETILHGSQPRERYGLNQQADSRVRHSPIPQGVHDIIERNQKIEGVGKPCVTTWPSAARKLAHYAQQSLSLVVSAVFAAAGQIGSSRSGSMSVHINERLGAP